MGLTNDERSSLVELRLEKQKTATMNEKNEPFNTNDYN